MQRRRRPSSASTVGGTKTPSAVRPADPGTGSRDRRRGTKVLVWRCGRRPRWCRRGPDPRRLERAARRHRPTWCGSSRPRPGRRAITAVGVGIAGLVDRSGRLLSAPNLPGVRDVAIGVELDRSGSACPSPSTTTPPARRGASTSAARPAAQDHAVLVTLGTGIGAGIVVDGEMHARRPRLRRRGRPHGGGPRRSAVPLRPAGLLGAVRLGRGLGGSARGGGGRALADGVELAGRRRPTTCGASTSPRRPPRATSGPRGDAGVRWMGGARARQPRHLLDPAWS